MRLWLSVVPRVAVVQDCNRVGARRVEPGVVLRPEPWHGVVSLCRKIATLSKPPHHLAGSFAVLPIHFGHPALCSQRDQKITSCRNIVQSIAVQPGLCFGTDKYRRTPTATR